MRSISKIYDAYNQCKPFSNKEAIALRDHAQNAANILVQMGDTFKIAFKEAQSIRFSMIEICIARGLDDTKS